MSAYDRQSFLGLNSEQVFSRLTVGLVGLGGGGSHVVQQLAHVGVGNFVLVDDDRIADTNLNRLVGAWHADIGAGTLKTDIAERLILGVNPEASVQKCAVVWQEAIDVLKTCDVIVGGLDSTRAKHELDAFTRRFYIPYIDMGMDVHRLSDEKFLIAGQVVLTGPGEPCLQCLGLVTEEGLAEEAARYGEAGGRPQVVWPNGVLASTAVGLLVQLVSPWHAAPKSAAFLRYDGNDGTMKGDAALTKFVGPCPHYSDSDIGDPMFDVRKFRAPVQSSARADVMDVTNSPREPGRSLIDNFKRWLRWPWRS